MCQHTGWDINFSIQLTDQRKFRIVSFPVALPPLPPYNVVKALFSLYNVMSVPCFRRCLLNGLSLPTDSQHWKGWREGGQLEGSSVLRGMREWRQIQADMYTCVKAIMFTRDRFQINPVRTLVRASLVFIYVFTRDRSETDPNGSVKNGPVAFVFHFWISSGPVPEQVLCKHFDRFQTVPCKQRSRFCPIHVVRSGIRFRSGPL